MGRNSPNPLQWKIVRLATRQHAVVELSQLVELGLSASGVRSRIAAGRLHRVHRSVYAVIDPRLLSREGRWLAAVLACGRGAALSHRSGAALIDLVPSARATIDVTVRSSARRRRPGIDIHRSGTLLPRDIEIRSGIPCTTVARTLLDLCDVVPQRSVRRAVERAEQLRIFDLAAIDDVLRRSAGRRGAAMLARLLAQNDIAETHTREELERRFLELCRDAKLPLPLVNHPVGPYVADFLWADKKLIAETDGWETHSTRTAFEHDRKRDQWLFKNGYAVVRFTWRQVVDDPRDVADTLSARLAVRRSAAGARGGRRPRAA